MRSSVGMLALALLSTQAGGLCNAPRPRLVCAEYFQSRAVVIATVAGISPVKDGYDDVTGTYYSMTVERQLRGQVDRLFRIYESNDSGRATFDWKTGDPYLLFLKRENPEGIWTIDGCGNSGPSERKQPILDQIAAIDLTANRAMIQGAVGGASISAPLAGVRVEARGPGDVKTAETGADGTFVLHVEPGQYQVRALSPERTFVPADLSYEDPDNLALESGSCAQVQFVEASQKP